MLKVFMVEDEIGIRESVRESLDWQSAGFEYLGDAPDGEIAIKSIRKLKPDIVITDIKMPFMDGLELAKVVRTELPDTRFVILSGHGDFSYAQQAIRLGGSEYLLKPISPAELMQSINRVAVEIHNERDSAGSDSSGIRKQRRNSFLHDLLSGVLVPAEIFAGLGEHGITLVENYYVAAFIKVDLKGYNLSRDVGIGEMVQRTANQAKGITLDWNKGEYVVIFQGEDEQAAIEVARQALISLHERIEAEFANAVYSGLGTATERLQEIGQSFAEAENAVNYALFTGSSQPCLAGQTVNGRSAPDLALSEVLDKGSDILHYGDLGAAKQLASEIRKAVADSSGGGIALRYAYIDILMTAAKAAGDMNIELADFLPDFSEWGGKAFSIKTPIQLEERVITLFERFLTYRQNHLANRYGELLAKAKQYIDASYHDPNLSLQKVAKAVHVSPTHFSAVFSRETGETFSDYLAKIRMANARRFLKTTAMSAAEISEKVGYKDPQYFSRVFKREVGMSIRSFRTKA